MPQYNGAYMYQTTLKQQLKDEKVKQHWGWGEKKALLIKKSVYHINDTIDL